MRKRGKNREKRDGRKGGGVSASLPTLETEATQMEKNKRKEKQNQQGRKKRERERQRDIVGIAILFFKGGKKEN